ncbi:MAG: transglycosylase SLT domain-containing protein [bacterium]
MDKARSARISYIVAALVLVCGLTSSAADTKKRADPASMLESASSRLRAGEYKKACAAASSAISHAKDKKQKGRAFFLSGYCNYRLQEFEKARKHLKKASNLQPLLSFHALYYGARSYQDPGKYKKAVELWEKLIASDPPGDLKGRATMELLRCHRRNRDADSTASALARVDSLSQKETSWQPELSYTRGWVRAEQGSYQKAREILVALWRDQPASFWSGQARALLEGSMKEKFLLPGEDSVFTEGERIRRVRKLLDRHRPEKALEEIMPVVKKAEKDSPQKRLVSLYELRGRAYMGKRSFDNAIADFKKSQKLAGEKNLELVYLTGRCHQRAGKHKKAINIYKDIWTNHPKCDYVTRALYYAARLKKLARDWQGAEKAYRRLVSDYPWSSLKPESMFQIAWLRYLQKDYGKAFLYLDRIPAKQNDTTFNARTLYWKSVTLRKTGRKEKAEKAEDEILKKYWKSPYAFYLVMLQGKKWPYESRNKIIPRKPEKLPVEYYVAIELCRAGLSSEADGQLDKVEDKGLISEGLAWELARMYARIGDYYRSQKIAHRKLGHRLRVPPPGEKKAWRLAYPRAFPQYVETYTEKHRLDPMLVWSLMRAESTYRDEIRSWAGAVGLMQIMPATGRNIAANLGEKGFKTEWLNDPETSIRYGSYYLRKRMNNFHTKGDDPKAWLETTAKALGAYNAGAGRIRTWSKRADKLGLDTPAFIEEIPIIETRNYIKRILRFYLVYLYTYPANQYTPEQDKFVQTQEPTASNIESRQKVKALE